MVLRAPARAARLERDLAAAIETEFGFAVPVVVRSAAQLAAVIAEDPFGDVVTEPKLYQVSFLAGPAPAGTEARLQELAAERRAGRGPRPGGLHVASGRHRPLQAGHRPRRPGDGGGDDHAQLPDGRAHWRSWRPGEAGPIGVGGPGPMRSAAGRC